MISIRKTALTTLIAAILIYSPAFAAPAGAVSTTVENASEKAASASEEASSESEADNTSGTYNVPPYLNPDPVQALKPYIDANDKNETLNSDAPSETSESQQIRTVYEKEPAAVKILWGIGGVIVGFIVFLLLSKAPQNKTYPKHPHFPKADAPESEAAYSPEDLDKYIEHANLYLRMTLNTLKTETTTLRSIQGHSPEAEFLRLSLLSRLAEHTDAVAKTNSRICFFDSVRCGTFQLRKINVDINTAAEKCAAAFESGDAKISFVPWETPLYAQIDYARFMDALNALLENAVRYGKRENDASITVSAKPADNGQILITVSDQGYGMEKTVANAMLSTFDEFKKSLTDESGAGLGIKFAETIIRLNEGTLWIISKSGEGTTACITVPSVPVAKDPD